MSPGRPLGVTHLLLKPNDHTSVMVTQRFPDALRTAKLAGKAEVRTSMLTLFELTEPLR